MTLPSGIYPVLETKPKDQRDPSMGEEPVCCFSEASQRTKGAPLRNNRRKSGLALDGRRFHSFSLYRPIKKRLDSVTSFSLSTLLGRNSQWDLVTVAWKIHGPVQVVYETLEIVQTLQQVIRRVY